MPTMTVELAEKVSMSTMVLEHVEEIVYAWRSGVRADRWDSPAGLPYPSGQHAEADLILPTGRGTTSKICGTSIAHRTVIL